MVENLNMPMHYNLTLHGFSILSFLLLRQLVKCY
jgi:hypothetical protein